MASGTVFGRVEQVRTGKIRKFETLDGSTRSMRSAFVKENVLGNEVGKMERARVTTLGIEGDEQGFSDHGGVDRAVCHFPPEAYEELREQWGLATLEAGAIGENVVTRGHLFSHNNVCIGDTFGVRRSGAPDGEYEVVLELCQPRYPCSKISMRHGVKEQKLNKYMLHEGKSGWFYRVVQEGTMGVGDEFVLIARPFPAWTVQRMCRVMYSPESYAEAQQRTDQDVLREILALPLAEIHWKQDARKWLTEMGGDE